MFKRLFKVLWTKILQETLFLQALFQKDGETLKNFCNLILDSTLLVALQYSAYLVVCCEMWAVCSQKICDFTADFDDGFAYNGDSTV